ncbi:hypothetical protein AB0I77_23325 [Streptomyces sp. NPDC050619]|uniref:hypothetical protein n=1 Tax=Streptomyces sp. NPDC050619 TaxID=3157214 RepID=UPI003445F2E1
MGRRRALLIGASDYEAPGIASLPFVPTDMAALGEALERRGVEVTVPKAKRQVGANFVNVEMARFLKKAQRGDALLVCLSGHGVHAEGQDYFVPEDAHPEIEPFEEGCVAIDWKRDLERSLADHIVILVDACREGIERDSQALNGITGWSRRKAGIVLRRKVAYVYACSPGQVARFVGRAERVQEGLDFGTRPGDSFSLFSRAVRDVLLHHPGALDLSGFKELVQARVEELHRAYGKTELQQLRVLMNAAGDPDDFPVVGPAPEADGEDTAVMPPVSTLVGPAAAAPDSMSTIPATDADDPGVRLARALYSFQLRGDLDQLLDFVADGPARDVVQLAAVVPESARARIWTACARRRPGPALCALRRLLRQEGDSVLELALLDDALRGRPPHEVLRGLDADEVGEILGHVTRTYPVPAVVSLVESLLHNGLVTEAGQLLYGAVGRPVDQLPALVWALRRAGLMRAAGHVLAHCGRHCRAVGLPTLLAVLESTGRRSDRGRVLDAVAGRPTADLAACLTELRAAGRPDEAADLLVGAVSAGTDTISRLTRELIRCGATAAAVLLLNTAAGRLPVSRVTDLLCQWAEEGPEGVPPQLLLMDSMVRVRGRTENVQLVRALCTRWLDRQARTLLALWTRRRPTSELPQLLGELASTGHHAECSYVLATVAARLPAQTVSAAFTALCDDGLGARAEHLVWMVVDRRPDDTLPEAFAALRDAGAGTELRRAVSAAVADPYRSVGEVLPALRALSGTEPARRLNAPDSRALLRTALLHRSVADLCVLVRALSDGGDTALLTWLRQEAAERLPVADLAELALILHAGGQGGEGQLLLLAAGASRPAEDLGPLVEALHDGEAPGTVVVLRDSVARSRPGADLSLFVRALRAYGRDTHAEGVLALVGQRRGIDVVATLVRELTTADSLVAAALLAELAAVSRPLDDVITLMTELLDSGCQWAAQRVVAGMAVRRSSVVVKVLCSLRESGRHDAAGLLLRASAGLCVFDDLRRLVHDLREEGLDEEADLAADALGAVRDPAELAVLLGQESDPPYDERERVMSSAARSRPGTDLLDLVGCTDAELRDWVLESIGVYCPVPVMAELVEALYADHAPQRVESIVRAACEQGRFEDVISLLRSVGFTDGEDIGGSARRLWDTFLTVLQDFVPTCSIAWARRLRQAGLHRPASQVLAAAVARPAEELGRTLVAAQQVEWDPDAQGLLEELARTGGRRTLLAARKAMGWDAAAQEALTAVLHRLPRLILAADARAYADELTWAMKLCPTEELIPTLVEAVGAADNPREHLVSAFFRDRTRDDQVRLLKALREAGLEDRVRGVMQTVLRYCALSEVATFVLALDRARAYDDVDLLLTVAADNPVFPTGLLIELREWGGAASAERLLRLSIALPQNYSRLPRHAAELAGAGLLDDARQIITAYVERCPDGRLGQTMALLNEESLRRWKKLLLRQVVMDRDLPVLGHTLTQLCEAGRLETAGELLAAVKRHRSAGEAETIEKDLAAAGHDLSPGTATASSRRAATGRRAFSRFRRTT